MHFVLSLISSILFLGGLTAAVPVAVEEQCLSQTICIDAVNPCGINCYDVCAVSAKPIPPPCPSTTTTKKVTTKVTTKKPTPTSTKKVTTKITTKKPTPTTTKKPVTTKIVTITKKITTSTLSTKRDSTTGTKCSATVSVCWDGINECGQMYGGCFPDCKPWPTFKPPPCPTPTRATLTAFPTDVITRVTTLPVLTLLDE
ncbi:hypothetical protein NEMBOFW57_002974 [Staphylotrichum longicolle]|uniref:Uncharacterized protein n=1 Tax=Staphylotrichum longicolle TaxID=669026 RepID=A0AAD4F541_9PEZI|nr:hypothetical protein NEMBOFW57_002974 [Staphylotrichum longicolle]